MTLPPRAATLLVVDDEPAVRTVIVRLLERDGFAVLSATGGQETIEILGQPDLKVDAVLLDVTMPHLHGRELLRAVRDLRPELPIALMSGYSRSEVGHRLGADLPGPLLEKPFSPAELRTVVVQLLAGSAASDAA